MNPVYAARIARCKAENAWKAVDRDKDSTMSQRIAAREAYAQAKRAYLAACKLARAETKTNSTKQE